MALRVSFFLLSNLITAVLCESTYISAVIEDASTQVVFTPSVCNQGQMVVGDTIPDGCETAWFIASDQNSTHNVTWHATQSPNSRALLQFEGSSVSWFSAPDSQGRGTADVFLDDVYIARVQLSLNNTGSNQSVWSRTDLDPSSIHNLTIVPLGDDIVTVDFFTVVASQNTSTPNGSTSSTSPPSAPVDASDPGGASRKDGSSGAVISAASIGAVALVVVACGGCFFLGKRRKSPGFHMPTVLVDIESALDRSDPPSPTSIRAWRESTHKSAPSPPDEGDTSDHERHHRNGSSKSRPPSYRSGKDPLYLSDSSDQSHEGHWQ